MPPLQMGTCSFHDCLHAPDERVRVKRLGNERLETRVERALSMRGEHMRTDGNGRRAAAFLRWQGAD